MKNFESFIKIEEKIRVCECILYTLRNSYSKKKYSLGLCFCFSITPYLKGTMNQYFPELNKYKGQLKLYTADGIVLTSAYWFPQSKTGARIRISIMEEILSNLKKELNNDYENNYFCRKQIDDICYCKSCREFNEKLYEEIKKEKPFRYFFKILEKIDNENIAIAFIVFFNPAAVLLYFTFGILFLIHYFTR